MSYAETALAPEYTALYAGMVVLPARLAEVAAVAHRLYAYMPVYRGVSAKTGVPAAVIAVIHERESDGDFSTNLANGDPLSARTVHVPVGRPVAGSPPFTWAEAAIDALEYDGLTKVSSWTLEQALFSLEGYNGFGYRNRGIRSPYLWGGTNQQQPGKYIADGVWDPSVTDGQLGCAPLLAALAVLDTSLKLPSAAGRPAKPLPSPMGPIPPPPDVEPTNPAPRPPSSPVGGSAGAIAGLLVLLLGAALWFQHAILHFLGFN